MYLLLSFSIYLGFFSEKFDKTMVEVQDWCYHRIFTNAYLLYETRSQNVFSSVKSPHFGIQQCHQQDRKVLFKVDHLRWESRTVPFSYPASFNNQF